MSLKRKLEGEVEIKEGAADLFHDMLSSRPHHVSGVSPQIVQDCELHEGTFGEVGSVIFWRLTLGGKPHVTKNVIEAIDNEKKMVRQRAIEGDLLKDYKSIVGIGQVIPKDKETSIARWTFEYQKLHPGIPEPTILLDSVLDVIKHIEDHHQRQNQ